MAATTLYWPSLYRPSKGAAALPQVCQMSTSVAPGSLPPCRRIRQASDGAGAGTAGIGNRLGEPQRIAMNRSLVVAMGLALAAGVALSHAALAQSPFPPAPQQSHRSRRHRSSLATDSPPHPAAVGVPGGAAAVGISVGPDAGRPADGRAAAAIGGMRELPETARRRQGKSRRGLGGRQTEGRSQQMCAAVQSFTAAEEKVVKFLEDNKTRLRGAGRRRSPRPRPCTSTR